MCRVWESHINSFTATMHRLLGLIQFSGVALQFGMWVDLMQKLIGVCLL